MKSDSDNDDLDTTLWNRFLIFFDKEKRDLDVTSLPNQVSIIFSDGLLTCVDVMWIF